MRDVSQAFTARLGAATTFCHCWQLTLRDGTRLGFTDHDLDLVFDGLTHAARSGWQQDDLDAALGFAPREADVTGALIHDVISDDDLIAGRLDGAEVVLLRVDWQMPDARVVLDRAVIGTIERRDGRFIAELRSAAAAFDQPVGRLYEKGCSADFGDGRCGLQLTPAMQQAGCDKTFETCRDRYGNAINFRGFPHMPGNDFVLAQGAGVVMDGGSLFR